MIKRQELKDLEAPLFHDNQVLTSFKRTMPMSHSFAEDGKSFLQNISEMDSHRLDHVKNELMKQKQEHKDQLQTRQMIDNTIKQIERVEDERHKHSIQ